MSNAKNSSEVSPKSPKRPRIAERTETRILVVAPGTPRADVAAGDLRFFAMLEILAKSYTVDFYAAFEDTDTQEAQHYIVKLQDIGVNVLKHRPLGLELAVFQHSYRIVIFEFWFCAEQFINFIRRQQPNAKIVVDTVDLHFLREEAGLEFGVSSHKVVAQNKQKEIKTYQQADTVIAVTDEDRDALLQQGPMPPVALVPMIVPIRARQERERGQQILFIGGFRHAPNVDGLLWFVNECWPRIRASNSEVELIVIGSHPPQEIRDLDTEEGIRVLGFVPDTAQYLENALLSVAPLRFGAGMKGKVTEAMAAGLAVVTTTCGSQGLSATSGEHLLVADVPELFAEDILALLSNPIQARHIGLMGQIHISQLCSNQVVAKQLENIVTSLTVNVDKDRLALFRLISFWHRIISIIDFSLYCFDKGRKKAFK